KESDWEPAGDKRQSENERCLPEHFLCSYCTPELKIKERHAGNRSVSVKDLMMSG
ncbi:hypothetical protein RUND412_009300, partial [Rhizina undulata]